MRPITLAAAGIAAGLTLVYLTAPAAAQDATAPPLEYVRVYTDAEGASRFADAAIGMRPVDIAPGIPPTPSSPVVPARGVVFRCAPVGGVSDWHGVPQRLFLFILSGTSEVEVSTGEVRRFGPGSVLLLEDTDGKGHRTRVVGEDRMCFGTVLLGGSEAATRLAALGAFADAIKERRFDDVAILTQLGHMAPPGS